LRRLFEVTVTPNPSAWPPHACQVAEIGRFKTGRRTEENYIDGIRNRAISTHINNAIAESLAERRGFSEENAWNNRNEYIGFPYIYCLGYTCTISRVIV
jgi:hypothetical protein